MGILDRLFPPRPEVIGLIDSREEFIRMMPWDDVAEVAGVEPAGMCPERYRVAGFPRQERLAALNRKVI